MKKYWVAFFLPTRNISKQLFNFPHFVCFFHQRNAYASFFLVQLIFHKAENDSQLETNFPFSPNTFVNLT